jgi:hypothetical protein
MADDTQAQAQTLTNEQVREQLANMDRRMGLMMHLEGNCIFILPPSVRQSRDTLIGLVDVCIEAIDIANSYDAQYGVDSNKIMEQELSLPDGMAVNGKSTMAVHEVIDWLRLESMIYDVLEVDDDEWDLREEPEDPYQE